MLADKERKLLRILSNFVTANNRVPSLSQLRIKSGRPIWDLERSLRLLAQAGFILWSREDHGQLRIVKEWEDEHQPQVRSLSRRSNEPWLYESF